MSVLGLLINHSSCTKTCLELQTAKKVSEGGRESHLLDLCVDSGTIATVGSLFMKLMALLMWDNDVEFVVC